MSGNQTEENEKRLEEEPRSRRRLALYVVLVGMAVFYLSPLEAGIMSSLKQDATTNTLPFMPPIAEFTLDKWATAFERVGFSLVNSMVYTLPAALLSAFFGSIAAYGLTKLEWRGQIGVLLLFFAGIFIPYQAILIPLNQFWANVPLEAVIQTLFDPITQSIPDIDLGPLPFGLRSFKASNYLGLFELIVTHTAYGIPICTILFRSYYQTISDEMVEAARIDGASVRQIYRDIILPLSKPMFAVTIIYQFTNIWNDLLFALVLVSNRNAYIATQQLNALSGAVEQNIGLQMAGAFLVAIPTLAIYIIFGEQFAEGVGGQT